MSDSHLIKGIARPSWDEIHMFQAISCATRSSCLKRAVGAVLVRDKRIIASGYAGAAPKVTNCLDLGYCDYENIAFQDAEKNVGNFEILREQYKPFCLAVHAEANALGQCSRFGIPAEGSMLFITNYPCPGCVQDHIITNKLEAIRVWKGYLSNPLLTRDEKRASERMLMMAGISVQEVELSDKRILEIAQLMTRVGERTDYKFIPSQSSPKVL